MLRAFLLGLVVSGLLVPATAHAARPLGLPESESLLFALQAENGTLEPAHTSGRYVLTLRGLASQGVWFSDRPARNSGAVASGQLFSAWNQLGFVAQPPNAVVSISGGRERSDTLAVELGTPRYDRRAHTVRFGARALSRLSRGLAHLGPSLDARIPRRFGKVAVFIDDATLGATAGPCDLGEADLFAGAYLPQDYVAPGQDLSDGQYDGLLSVLHAAAGTVPGTFVVPPLSAPAGLRYGVCAFGIVPPDPGQGQADVDGAGCTPGEVQLQLQNWRIGGWVATAGLPAPTAGQWLTCADASQPGALSCLIGQVTQFSGVPLPADYVPADGRSLAVAQYSALFAVMNANGVTSPPTTFAVPNLPPGAPGDSWGICATGTFPVRS